MLILENIRLALSAIRTNKMRSFLTMLGIIIGISSVIAITAIGSSIQGVVDKEFENFGKNAMYVYPNWEMVDDYIPSEAFFSIDELDMAKEKFAKEIRYIDPSPSETSDVRVGKVEGKINLTGCAPGLDRIMNLNITHGRMINQADLDGKKNRLVLESSAAQNLFGVEDAVGKELSLTVEGDSQDFTIIGIYKEAESIFSGMNRSGNFSGYVPYTVMAQQADSSYSFLLYSFDGVDQEKFGERVTSFLARTKGMPDGYYNFESSALQQNKMNDMLGIVSMAIGVIAGISLLVGGIGIMNIMLVSVTERTREIGIRKSLGARTKDILLQFLIESMIISAIGGMIGTLLGIGIAAIGMKVAHVSFAINPIIIFIAVGFAALVGMFFGIYPARRAAKLDPIEALRYE
ncbi:MAG: ABC transporter permease [Anaerovorax sp.]|nr:ABC transporter permease [Anaerovorax sp.]